MTSLQIVGMSDVNNTQQPEPSEPALEGYAVTDIIPAKDIKKDKKVCMYVYLHLCSYIDTITYIRTYVHTVKLVITYLRT